MKTQDEKLENILADPWLARPAVRWPTSLIFVLVALFALKPLIINRIISRAEAYSSNGLYNNATRECKKAIFLDAGNIPAWNTLGDAYKEKGDIENAVNTYLNTINIDPDNKISHFKVAVIFALAQDYNRAVPHFEIVRSLGPESQAELIRDSFTYFRSSLEMLSLCFERTGKYDKQQEVLRDLARTYPDYKKAVQKLETLKKSAASKTNP